MYTNRLPLWLLLALATNLSASPFARTITEIKAVGYEAAALDNSANAEDIHVDEFNLKSTLLAKDYSWGKLVLGGHYKYTQFDISDQDEVHGLSANIRFIHASQRWIHVVAFTPGIYSDFDQVDGDDLDLSFNYVAIQEKSDELEWQAGLGYSRQFGDPRLFPILSAKYTPNSTWQYELGFPTTAIRYAPTPMWHSYAALSPNGGKWNIETDDKNINIVYSSFEFNIGLEYQLAKNSWLGIEAGRAFNRTIDINDTDNNRIGEVDVDDSTFIGFHFRITQN